MESFFIITKKDRPYFLVCPYGGLSDFGNLGLETQGSLNVIYDRFLSATCAVENKEPMGNDTGE